MAAREKSSLESLSTYKKYILYLIAYRTVFINIPNIYCKQRWRKQRLLDGGLVSQLLSPCHDGGDDVVGCVAAIHPKNK